MQKIITFIIREWLCCFLHVNYIVYRSLHIWVLDPTCVQNFRSVAPTAFEIQGLKLNKKKKKKKKQKNNWRNGLLPYLPC